MNLDNPDDRDFDPEPGCWFGIGIIACFWALIGGIACWRFR